MISGVVNGQMTDRGMLNNNSRDILLKLDSLEIEYNFQPRVNYEVGTSAFTNFDGFYGFNTYVAPKMVFQPAKRWIIDGGVFLGRTQMYNMPYPTLMAPSNTMDQTVLTMGAYARGTYLVNDKLYMGGTGYLNYNTVESNLPNDRNNAYNNISGETFVGYKFSDSFRVEASFRFGETRSNNPYHLKER